MTRLNAAGGLWLLLALAPCGEPSSTERPAAVETKPLSPASSAPAAGAAAEPSGAAGSGATQAQQTPTTKRYMERHFADAVQMRQAIVAGKLAAFQAAAARVAADEWTPSLRPDYASHVEALRALARTAQAAPSLREGAQTLGALGSVCADCHRQVGAVIPDVPTASVTAGADPSMVAHAMAADALWRGLVAPSDATWASGARGLLDAPALDSDVADVAAAARHLKQLAQQSAGAQGKARGQLLGDVLSTCSACHERVGVKIAEPAAPR